MLLAFAYAMSTWLNVLFPFLALLHQRGWRSSMVCIMKRGLLLCPTHCLSWLQQLRPIAMTTVGSGVAVLLQRHPADNSTVCVELLPKLFLFTLRILSQEAKYIERWPNTTSAWAGWSKFDIPVDRYGGVRSQLICTSSSLGSSTCH